MRHVVEVTDVSSENQLAKALGLELGERLSGGEFGAFKARNSHGNAVVLKVLVRSPVFALDRVSRAVELSESLRLDGYPAPEFLDVGQIGEDVYTVQEFIEAAVPDHLTANTVGKLIELIEWHRDRAARVLQGPGVRECSDPDAGRTLVSKIIDDGSALLDEISDERVAALLRWAVAIAESSDPDSLRTGDVFHGDFHARNLLVRDERVLAVFDWEGARAGDRRADLLRLTATSITLQAADTKGAQLLREAVIRRVPVETRALLAAKWTVQDLNYGVRWKPIAIPFGIGNGEVYRDLCRD